MSDDWRLRIDLHEHGAAHELTERLEAGDLEHDLETAYLDRVAVTRDQTELFFYSDTREQAERVAELTRSLAAEHRWNLDCELRRWHPVAEDWEDPDKPLPEDDSERAAERATLMESEDRESQAQGYPDFEVRVQCASHRDAVKLAERLGREGLPRMRRWRYVFVGASDEDAANALAKRLEQEVPPGSTITAEGSRQAANADLPPRPFAFLGGIGG